jgi:hypothetical protein
LIDSGTLKQRFSDFLVYEIAPDGEVAHLTTTDIVGETPVEPITTDATKIASTVSEATEPAATSTAVQTPQSEETKTETAAPSRPRVSPYFPYLTSMYSLLYTLAQTIKVSSTADR